METVQFAPQSEETPTSVEEIVQIVSDARRRGQSIKAVGGCASMSRVDVTAGRLIQTYKLTGIKEETRQVGGKRVFWLEAGVGIAQAVQYLRIHNLAMPNLGGWTGQTVVGGVMTATHGSGKRYPPLCESVRAIHYVMGDGRQYVIEPSSGRYRDGEFGSGVTLLQDDEVFHSSVVTVGSLGVVYRILWEPVAYYYIHQKRWMTSWAELGKGGDLERVHKRYDHVEVWFNPYGDECLVTARKRYEGDYRDDQTPLENARREAQDNNITALTWESWLKIRTEAAESRALREAGTAWAAAIEMFQRVMGFSEKALDHPGAIVSAALRMQARATNVFIPYAYVFDTGVANFFKVLASEVSVEASRADELLQLMKSYTNEEFKASSAFASPYSMRWVSTSQHKLAMAFDQPTVSLEVITLNNGESAEEELMLGWAKRVTGSMQGSRLHWGLQHSGVLDEAYVQERYPGGFSLLRQLSSRFDPSNVTRSSFLAMAFGISA